MGGVAQAAVQAVGLSKKPDAPQAPAPSETASKETRASAYEEQDAARKRGAARRNRVLLSDARLGSADETLGGGNSLGQ
jgi:hypothetical protein